MNEKNNETTLKVKLKDIDKIREKIEIRIEPSHIIYVGIVIIGLIIAAFLVGYHFGTYAKSKVNIFTRIEKEARASNLLNKQVEVRENHQEKIVEKKNIAVLETKQIKEKRNFTRGIVLGISKKDELKFLKDGRKEKNELIDPLIIKNVQKFTIDTFISGLKNFREVINETANDRTSRERTINLIRSIYNILDEASKPPPPPPPPVFTDEQRRIVTDFSTSRLKELGKFMNYSSMRQQIQKLTIIIKNNYANLMVYADNQKSEVKNQNSDSKINQGSNVIELKKQVKENNKNTVDIIKPATFYSIQIRAYQEKEMADQFQEELRNKGYAPYINSFQDKNGVIWYRIRVGHFNSYENAKQFRDEKLLKDGYNDVMIFVVENNS